MSLQKYNDDYENNFSPKPKRDALIRRRRSSPVRVRLENLERHWFQCAMECNYPAIRSLLEQDPNLATKQDIVMGYTAIHWAAKKGKRDVVDLIGKTGMDINVRTRGGYTALHLAIIQGHEEIISMLVDDYDANINIRDNSGRKPKHYSRDDMSPWIQRKVGKTPAPSVLITPGDSILENIGSMLVQMKAFSNSLGTGLDKIDTEFSTPTTSKTKVESSSLVKLCNSFKGKYKKDKQLQLDIPDEPEVTYRRTGRAKSAPNINHITNWTPRVLLVPP